MGNYRWFRQRAGDLSRCGKNAVRRWDKEGGVPDEFSDVLSGVE